MLSFNPLIDTLHTLPPLNHGSRRNFVTVYMPVQSAFLEVACFEWILPAPTQYRPSCSSIS